MANSILTPSVIGKESLMRFKNKVGFTKNANKQYSKEFAQKGAKIGNTITIRKPARYTVSTGPALNLQSVVEESQALVLSTQAHVDFDFSSVDLTLTIDDFMERYVDGAIDTLASSVDLAGLEMAAQNTANFVGVPGTTPNASLTYMQAQQKINEMACPKDKNRGYFISTGAEPVIVDALKGLFQSSERIAEQYESGMMGQGLGGDWYMSQNIWNRSVGNLGGTPTVNGAGQTGSSLVTQGWSDSVTGLLNVGDRFQIAGVHSVNPITKQSTGNLQCFVITAAANSSGSGAATVSIYPSIVTSGPTQTVDSSPANSAAITVSGAATAVSPQNILAHKNAFTLGCADLEMPDGVDFKYMARDPESGLSMRLVRAYDINSDTFPCRLDLLYGWAPMRPEWACAIQG